MKDIGTNTHRADRFALYRNDGKIDDVTVISGIRQAYFRLHPVGRFRESDGCITLPSLAQFTRLRAFLKAQPTLDVPRTKLKAYGRVTGPMKIVARIVLALLLTLPIYAGVTAIPWLSHWFNDGAGWDVVAPIFRALGSEGGEQNDDFLLGSLLAISFVLALISSWIVFAMFGWIVRRSHRRDA